jgi:hypothetical protein
VLLYGQGLHHHLIDHLIVHLITHFATYAITGKSRGARFDSNPTPLSVISIFSSATIKKPLS